MSNIINIWCKKHGYLNEPYKKTKIHIGRSIIDDVTCAFCQKCNVYYTNALAITLGEPEPVDGCPVKQGKLHAMLSPVSDREEYDKKPSLLNKDKSITTIQSAEQAIKEVYLTPFKIGYCLYCNKILEERTLMTQNITKKGSLKLRYCEECKRYYSFSSKKYRNFLDSNRTVIKQIPLKLHIQENQRYYSRSKSIESTLFSFALVNKEKAFIYTIVLDYKEQNSEERILHFMAAEARKIMTAYFYESARYTFEDNTYTILLLDDLYEKQKKAEILFSDSQICVEKHNNGGYYSPNGRIPMIALIYCVESRCLEAAQVSYDEEEDVYLMDYTVYRSLFERFGLPIGSYVGRKRNNTYEDLNDESKLHMLGYNVSDEDGMSDSMRQTLLANIVECGFLEVSEIVNHLEFLIRLNNGRSEKSIRRWQSDKVFIQNYRVDESRLLFFKGMWDISWNKKLHRRV